MCSGFDEVSSNATRGLMLALAVSTLALSALLASVIPAYSLWWHCGTSDPELPILRSDLVPINARCSNRAISRLVGNFP